MRSWLQSKRCERVPSRWPNAGRTPDILAAVILRFQMFYSARKSRESWTVYTNPMVRCD